MIDNKKLERNPMNKVIGGVCSGLADYFNLDIALVRVAFVIAGLFASFGFWLYIILWIVLPENGSQRTTDSRQQSSQTQWSADDSSYTTNGSNNQTEENESNSKKTTSIIAGASIILIGLIFLVNNFVPISWVWKLWPLILVVIGMVMIFNATKKGNDNE
ncbi:MAG: PspC domain-containing protein [Bacteroidales bacterium]|nr:PspC domain-containing protein [Bacteroidales bacterium]